MVTAESANKTIGFEYDSDGLRTKKAVNGGTTHYYFYAGGQLLRESYSGNFLDFSYDANGYPYALKYNGTTYYYITNLQGDVMYLVDGTGATVASYEYDPYGNIISATGTMAEINPLRYRGYYYDAELEMYYLQSRYYDPMVGRFINADDVSYLGLTGTSLSYNLLAYCENDPVNTYDPFGCFVIRRWMVASVIDVILMLIPGIGAAFAPIKSMAKAYGKAALKANIKTPLVSFIKFIGKSAKAVLSGVKNIVAKIPAIGKRLAQKIPVNKLVNALAGLTASVTFNKVLNSLIENVDIVLSVGGAISGILDVAFDKKLNDSIWEI